jgi:hypothetical protein
VIPLLLAAALPGLFWDQPPDTAASLKQAGITRVLAPVGRVAEWKTVSGITVEPFDIDQGVKLLRPGVQMRVNEASATRSPWVDTNGANYLRQPQGRFYCDAPGPAAPLAAAEAYMFGGTAAVRTDSTGLEPLARMLAFLQAIPEVKLPTLANIGFVDDGSAESVELMKLLIRRNLLFRVIQKAGGRFDLTVQLGTKQYPKEEAVDPSEMAQKIRFQLGDEKRLLRIYGSNVVIGRLDGDGKQARLHLLNYSGAARPVNGIRIRVSGRYPKQSVRSSDTPDLKVQESSLESDSTEFTLPDLKVYVVIDLAR